MALLKWVHTLDVPAELLRRAAPPRPSWRKIVVQMMRDHWQQVEELYHAAQQDRAVLDKADPELRQEVEAALPI